MNGDIFRPADILLPRVADMGAWSVIACDQFSSDRDYWDRVAARVGDAPSTLRMILPETYLEDGAGGHFAREISLAMRNYLDAGIFREYKDSLVYVERRLSNGRARRGLVGAIDLDRYDYSPDSGAPVRASEMTDPARLPPRVAARASASLELPHVIALMDDAGMSVIEPIEGLKNSLEELYDFDLMEGGGHITGWRVTGGEAARVCDLVNARRGAAAMIIGDGNHSLAAAKTRWDELKRNGRRDAAARYALVELNNVYDPAVEFKPIHRMVFGVDARSFARDMERAIGGPGRYGVEWRSSGEGGKFSVAASRVGDAIGAAQSFIDEISEKTGCRVDYIHGSETLESLSSRTGNVGIIMPAMDKSDFFGTVLSRGVFPRKSFSIGESRDKRYYLECGKIA
ncbi:MAG: DUF1015 domain-containing protein [Synergistaceae bacterium]|jgi:uncharacterized protein (DUF1015 family)|nr:DUF1015 domain-containing protein [Synergistaceae bacterium]